MSIPDLLGRLSKAEQAGVFHLAGGERLEIEAATECDGYLWTRMNLEGVRSQRELLGRFVEAFELPEYFGYNWDALLDSLSDLQESPAPGYVLLLEGYESFRSLDAESFAKTLSVLADVADRWRPDDTPFWTLLPLPREGRPFLPQLPE